MRDREESCVILKFPTLVTSTKEFPGKESRLNTLKYASQPKFIEMLGNTLKNLKSHPSKQEGSSPMLKTKEEPKVMSRRQSQLAQGRPEVNRGISSYVFNVTVGTKLNL